MFFSCSKKDKAGFTLIEILVGAAVFLIVALAVYRAYTSLFILTSASQYKVLALNLANEQFEIVRNLSYADVGISGGLPNGKIPHTQTLVRGGVTFEVTMTVRNVDLPFDGLIGGSPNDLSPADNKLVEVNVECDSCKDFKPLTLTTTIAPKNLETASNNGALFVKVFDANGIAIQGVDVQIVNATVNPNIVIQDVTDANGMLQVVDVPPGINAYSISVSKPGYSSATTYPPGGIVNGYLNSTPTQPDATVVVQQVTQVSFALDKLSTLSFSSVTPLCVAVGGVDFNLRGSKTVGLGVPEFLKNLTTDIEGLYSTSTLAWDSYSVTGIDAEYDIIGLNPLNPIPLNPDSVQEVKMIVQEKAPRSLLVTVKDSVTQLPLTGAVVQVTGPDSYDVSKTTDRGYISQTDWSAGSGQQSYTNTSAYLSDNGSVSVDTPVGEIRLKDLFGSYANNGILESSTIDTGSPSNFYNLTWEPLDQPVETGLDSLKFQLATNKTLTPTTTWSFKGPDGTASTFYTSTNSVISDVHDDGRFLRYKVFMSTESATSTPNLANVSFTFTSDCTPPGQVVFPNLGAGVYHVTVSKTGYADFQVDVNMDSDWVEQQIILAP